MPEVKQLSYEEFEKDLQRSLPGFITHVEFHRDPNSFRDIIRGWAAKPAYFSFYINPKTSTSVEDYESTPFLTEKELKKVVSNIKDLFVPATEAKEKNVEEETSKRTD